MKQDVFPSQHTGTKKQSRRSLKTGLAVMLSVSFALGLFLTQRDQEGVPSSGNVMKRHWNSGGFEEVFSKLGPYSPYADRTDSSASYDLPSGCEVSQVTILQRHGARYPTKKANVVIQTALTKLANLTASQLPSEFKFLDGYTFFGFEVDALTDFGRKEAYDAGKVAGERYQKLAKKSNLWTRSSDEARVVESGRQFIQGFNSAPFFIGNVSALPNVDVKISEEDGFVNPLSPSTCEAENVLDPNPGDVAEEDWLSVYAPPIAKRLNAVLPGANLSNTDINSLMSLCGFDSLRNVTLSKSPWCDAFTAKEWKMNEYYFDVSKYYAHGHGAPFGAINGASYIDEVVARLLDTDQVVQAGVTNLSLISPAGGERVFADFSHDNAMVEILTNLPFLTDKTPLPTTPSTESIPSHKFVVSEIVPFSGRFAFERITCTATKYRNNNKKTKTSVFVRTLVNNAIQTTHKYWDGLVPIEAFLKSVKFAQEGGDWAKCAVAAK
ncbi:histidine phosphatase superfamily [Mrakia frigida]|uniref:histidine phosphatase superfamily n=1 Tax=Mrakia frigida TaxID=29902 RepID=UPI003FCC1232